MYLIHAPPAGNESRYACESAIGPSTLLSLVRLKGKAAQSLVTLKGKAGQSLVKVKGKPPRRAAPPFRFTPCPCVCASSRILPQAWATMPPPASSMSALTRASITARPALLRSWVVFKLPPKLELDILHVKPPARTHTAAPFCDSHCHQLRVVLTLRFLRRQTSPGPSRACCNRC